jgi:light-regulated signal transduction histidine kinase (bacteriophytochrome)
MTEERRTFVLELCHDLGESIRPAMEHCDVLLGEMGDSLNQQQIDELHTLRRCAERVLPLADEISQSALKGDHLFTEPEAFEHFLHQAFHDLRTPVALLIGFAQVLLNEMLGPLSGEQRETLTCILELGKALQSSLDERQHAATDL